MCIQEADTHIPLFDRYNYTSSELHMCHLDKGILA